MASPPQSLSLGEVSVEEGCIHTEPEGCSLPCPRILSGGQRGSKETPPPPPSEQGRRRNRCSGTWWVCCPCARDVGWEKWGVTHPNRRLSKHQGKERQEAAPGHSRPPWGPCTFCELRAGFGGPGRQPKRGGAAVPLLPKKRVRVCGGAEDRTQVPWQAASRVRDTPAPSPTAGLGVGGLGTWQKSSSRFHMLKAMLRLHFQPQWKAM